MKFGNPATTIQITNTVVALAAAPPNPIVGEEYFDTTLNALGVYGTTGWQYPRSTQSGAATVTTNSSGLATVTFPVPFDTAPTVVTCGNATGTAHQVYPLAAPSTTSFTVAVFTLAGALVVSGGPLNLDWIAVGT